VVSLICETITFHDPFTSSVLSPFSALINLRAAPTGGAETWNASDYLASHFVEETDDLNVTAAVILFFFFSLSVNYCQSIGISFCRNN